MYEQLSIYITRNKAHGSHAIFIITFLLLTSVAELNAQQLEIFSVRQSSTKPILTDIYLYVSGSREDQSLLYTSNNNIHNNKNTYSKYVDFGTGIEIYRNPSIFQFFGYFGYKYESLSYDKSIFVSEGVDSHWLSTDIKAEISCLGIGIKTDYFINSKVQNSDNFSYNGIYSDCFNKVSVCSYLAVQIRFTRLKFEVRIGPYIVPHINPDKIAYYNLTKSSVNGLYLDFRISYRIFTTGDPRNTPHFFNL